jgi:hypothetical protein
MRTQATKKARSTSTVPQSAATQTDWLCRFADCLMLLHPNTVAVAVARHVAATSPADSVLPPEEAALKFMFEQPMDEVGIPH